MYKGIPDRVRGTAWKKMLGVDMIMAERRGVYEVVYLKCLFVCGMVLCDRMVASSVANVLLSMACVEGH